MNECFLKSGFWGESLRLYFTTAFEKNYCSQIQDDHFKIQLRKEMPFKSEITKILEKKKKHQSETRQIPKTSIHPFQSQPPKYHFLTYQGNLIPLIKNHIRNRIYWRITGTYDYLWGYVPHVDITFVLTEAVCCFPTERLSLLTYQKIERRQRGKTLQRKNSYPLMCFHRA